MNKEGSQTKGRRLGPALSYFAAMLIEEALDLSGLTVAQLAKKWDVPYERVKRYSRYPGEKGKIRGLQVASIQWLENEVAKLLQRSAHTVVIKYSSGDLAKPTADLNVRNFNEFELRLGYGDGWPTYGCLKFGYENFWPTFGCLRGESQLEPSINELVKQGASFGEWPKKIQLYAWQWGILWDKGLPWLSRAALGVQENIAVESFLPSMTNKAKWSLADCPPDEYFDIGPPDDFDSTCHDVDLGTIVWKRWKMASNLRERNLPPASRTRFVPEICRNGVVIYRDFGRSRVTKSLVKSSDDW